MADLVKPKPAPEPSPEEKARKALQALAKDHALNRKTPEPVTAFKTPSEFRVYMAHFREHFPDYVAPLPAPPPKPPAK